MVMTKDWFFTILKFFHFSKINEKCNKYSPTYKFWKIQVIFDALNESFKSVYNPIEQLSTDDVIVEFNSHVCFSQILKEKIMGNKVI